MNENLEWAPFLGVGGGESPLRGGYRVCIHQDVPTITNSIKRLPLKINWKELQEDYKFTQKVLRLTQTAIKVNPFNIKTYLKKSFLLHRQKGKRKCRITIF